MADLAELLGTFNGRLAEFQLAINGRDYASKEEEDRDLLENCMFEGLFLRAFTEFERVLEAAFFHYVEGGVPSFGVPLS